MCNNKLISDEIKDVIYALDTRNDARYADFSERISPPKHQWRKWKEHDADGDNDEWDASGAVVEEIDEEHAQMLYCAFDRDVDLVRGLYNGDYKRQIPSTIAEDEEDEEKEEEEEEEEDLLNINEELYHKYGRDYVQKRLPGENQYRLIFNNHTVMHYFVSRFMRKEVVIKREALTFSVRVLQYTADRGNVRALVPLCKQYTGNAKAYTEGQMYHFKHEHEVVAIRLKDGGGGDIVYEGLLHPSDSESYGGQGCSYNCTHYQNVYEQMYPARRVTSQQTMAFQTLYIDLAQAGHRVRLLDYRTRRDVLAPVKQLNDFLQCNNLRLTASPVVVAAPSTSTDDTMQPIIPPPSRTQAVKKRIKNQPLMGDFVSQHQVNMTSAADVFEKMGDSCTPSPSLKRKSPATPIKSRKGDTYKKQKSRTTTTTTTIEKKTKTKKKKKKKPVGGSPIVSARDPALFFRPYGWMDRGAATVMDTK